MGIPRQSHMDINRLADGPIGPYVDAFKQYLTERRYAEHTVASYVTGITHFARWARSRRLRLPRIDEGAITEFLDSHLPNCKCSGPTRHDRGDHSAALGHLLVVLRVHGAVECSCYAACTQRNILKTGICSCSGQMIGNEIAGQHQDIKHGSRFL
ncbi:site-specific integrase [Alcaligenaceae bacterium]|nr:site-specific integrase [Alcaligenaceae bacterium]